MCGLTLLATAACQAAKRFAAVDLYYNVICTLSAGTWRCNGPCTMQLHACDAA